jgi:uncharacterized protein (TIGR02996 family)
MLDEETFLQAILTAPHDVSLRLIYADALEELGDARAEFLRLEAELYCQPKAAHRTQWLNTRLQELRPEINADWLALLDRTLIEGCFQGGSECPKNWDCLKPTAEGCIRFCETCQKKVFHCASVEHAQRHANFGHPVAVDSRVPRREGDLYTSPSRDPEETRPGRGPAAPRFHVGQAVRVRSGPYRDSLGRIERLCLADLRAKISIEGPERPTNVEVDFEDLEHQR